MHPGRRSLLWLNVLGGIALALVGTLFFSLQTALLDALIWPALFPV